MNYLAHAFLSDNNNDLLVGNFIADHLRGKGLSEFPAAIAQGIQLHRRIDSFTDAHPCFRKCKRFFYKGFEKHSGILVDMFFDHLLAKNFRQYSNESLDAFSENVYEVYNSYLEHFPEGSSKFLSYVVQNNIYTSYASIDGITRVLDHLSRRIRHDIRLEKSVTLFIENEEEMQSNFLKFFSEAISEFLGKVKFSQ